jgi:hypothetical protein
MTRRQVSGLIVIVVAVLALVAGTAFALGPGRAAVSSGSVGYGMMDEEDGSGPDGGFGGMMGGASGGMMGGGSSFGVEGTGAVDTMDQARSAAQRYADELGLGVGEVMEFRNGFYAELETAAGTKATEVLIDPGSGDVRIEYGPASMWNTEYGMHGRALGGGESVSADEARQLANVWLTDHMAGTTVGEADEFPGYYTLHTERDGDVTGMLSVNARTGAVWYHTWHGDFVAMSEE